MRKDKYTDLTGHLDIRVRVERLDGNWRGDREIWWDRELIAFITSASPSVPVIVEAEAKIVSALKDLAVQHQHSVDLGAAPNARGEVIMFHGTFVKIEVWCPPGTATLLGIKGYGS
jgi:hypothetical protein